MSAYMIIVLSILLFFGEFIWDIPYAKADKFYEGDVPLNKAIHYTILFNTFIYMQLFNEINCRMVGARQFNVFHNLQRNWVFVVIVAGTAVLQYFFV
jgi:Ca2+ transporting ATPase